MPRNHWPESWGADFAALLNFREVRAIENGSTVILLGADNAAFAIVPVTIELGVLQATLSILRESFDMGVKVGRDVLQAQFRELIGIKQGG
jgi:hypothetical protein